MPASRDEQVVSIQRRLDAFKAEHGDTVAIEEVNAVVSNLVLSLQGDIETASLRIGAELRRMLDFISSAKEEIAAIRPNNLSKKDIPGATDELDAIVASTEEAAGKIMDAADEVTEIAGEVDEALAERLQNVATQIFEASSFQDITGQRVTKVVRVLKMIEERLAALAEAVGDTHVDEESSIAVDKDGLAIDDKDLLHGPQLEGAGNDQDDIDALLASFD